MRRRRRAAALLLLLGAIAVCSSLGTSAPCFAARAAKQRVADVASASIGYFVQAVATFLPGAVVAAIGYVVSARRQQLDRKSWAMLVAVLFVSSVIWAANARKSVDTTESPQAIQGPVHSGEAKLMEDGRLVSLPDPARSENAPVLEGWQKALASALTEAVKVGREQVVLVFSRQGCPWCERQLPVLQRAMESRTRDIGAIAAAAGGFSAESDGRPGGAGLLLAPLRVFVLDTEEFPSLAQRFGVQALPTSLFFGQSGVRPLAAQGYLDDEQIAEMLHAAALAQPPSRTAARQRTRRPRFRALFR